HVVADDEPDSLAVVVVGRMRRIGRGDQPDRARQEQKTSDRQGTLLGAEIVRLIAWNRLPYRAAVSAGLAIDSARQKPIFVKVGQGLERFSSFRLRSMTAASLFHPAVAEWFDRTFPAPTGAQARAWPAIASRRPVLIAAPTGSGKTL